jgi:Hsp20/alpha crystallin family
VEPFLRGEVTWGKAPEVDAADTATGYEITAELPGLDEKNIEVKLSDGTLTIRARRRKRKKRRRKIIIFLNGMTARSNAPSACPTGSMRRRSRRQERHSDCDFAEDGRCAEKGKEDRDQEGLNLDFALIREMPGRLAGHFHAAGHQTAAKPTIDAAHRDDG